MARGRKTGGRDFVKGDPRAGRPKKPKDLAEATKMTKTEFEYKFINFMHKSVDELKAIVQNKNGKTMDHWIATIILMGLTKGDEKRLTFMFDRMFGKLQDNRNITVNLTDSIHGEIMTQILENQDK